MATNLGTNNTTGSITTVVSPGVAYNLSAGGTWKIRAKSTNTEEVTYFVAGVTAASDLPTLEAGEEDYFRTRGDTTITVYSASGSQVVKVKRLVNG